MPKVGTTLSGPGSTIQRRIFQEQCSDAERRDRKEQYEIEKRKNISSRKVKLKVMINTFEEVFVNHKEILDVFNLAKNEWIKQNNYNKEIILAEIQLKRKLIENGIISSLNEFESSFTWKIYRILLEERLKAIK